MQEQEGHTFDDTYDFTLRKSEAGSVSEHNGRPAVRVALAYGVRAELPGDGSVDALDYPDGSLDSEEVSVAKNGYEGVAVEPIPGSIRQRRSRCP